MRRKAGTSFREARVWNKLGTCYMNAGQYADALAMFEKVLALVPDHAQLKPLALQNIALVALLVKELSKGISAAKAALASAPDPKTAHECLTRIQNELTFIRLMLVIDQVDEAVKHARAAR